MGTLHFAGPGIASGCCIYVKSTFYAFPLLDLCTGDVMTVNMTYTGGTSSRERACTSVYLPCDSNHPYSRSYGTLKVTVVGIQCCSSLDMMLLHTTFCGAAWTSIHKENVQ